MHGVELRDRLAIGVGIPRRRQRALRHLNDEERDVEAALVHLRQVHLRRQAPRVVARGGEMGGSMSLCVSSVRTRS